MKKVKDRNKKFCEIIPELTPDYFGVRLTTTDFRKIMETKLHKDVEHLPVEIKNKLLQKSFGKLDHSVQIAN